MSSVTSAPRVLILALGNWFRAPREQVLPHTAADVYHDARRDEPDLVEAYFTMGRAQLRWFGCRALDIRNENLRHRFARLEQEA